MRPTALLTGSTGFIGGALARRLVAEGWRVVAIVRSHSRALADLRADERFVVYMHDGTAASLSRIVGEAAPNVVFHLASLFLADHHPDQIDDLIASNVLFGTQLVEAMAGHGVRRLVNTGTSWQHFGAEPNRPVNLYAATKQAFEDILSYYHDARQLSVIHLKLFDTWGRGDTRRKLINILFDAALTGQQLDMSPGEQVIDLTHVDDVVDAFLRCATLLLDQDTPIERTFFVSGERHSVKGLVDLVGRALERPIGVNFGGRPYRPREVFEPIVPADAQKLPGWRPTRTLARDLRSILK